MKAEALHLGLVQHSENTDRPSVLQGVCKGRFGVPRAGTDAAAGGTALGDGGAVVAQDGVTTGGRWCQLCGVQPSAISCPGKWAVGTP